MEAMTDLIKAEHDSKEETKRNILLETFDSIRDDLRRGPHLFSIKVRVVSGRQIQGSNISPKVCILFKKQKRWTQRDTNSTNEPFWGENFYFNCVTDVEDLLRENVTFRVVNSRVLRRNLVIGEFQLSLVLVAGEKSRSMFNRWLALVDQNDPSSVCKGFLKVCVALIFPNEQEVHWPDPLAFDSVKEDTEVSVLTCSGHQFLKMTFIMAVYLMQDIPRYDFKGRKVTDVAIALSFAGNTVTSEPLSLPDEIVSEPYQIKKELRLTISWPSMCDKIILSLLSVSGKEYCPLCSHTFFVRDIAVESYSSLKHNVRPGMPQVENELHLETNKNPKGTKNARKPVFVQKKKDKKEGFMPMIGPCFVNMYGAPLDLMEDKVEPGYIESLNSGVIEGCAYRGRMFVRLQSEFCDSTNEATDVKDLYIGTKEQRDLLSFAKSNTFLLFGMISSVPMISDAKSAMQFEVSIGHNGLNSLSPVTHAHPFPSTSFCANPKEILKTQRILSGHSYSTLSLDNGKPAFLVESTWEDIRYRIHFYNFILFLENKWEKKKNPILMSYKLGLCRRRTLNSIRHICHEMIQHVDSAHIPTNSSNEAGLNDMDRSWRGIREQQINNIKKKLSALHNCALSYSTSSLSEIAKVARILCERLPDVSLLLDNIKKEPQLSIPDVFIYLLVNNERRAYARLPVSSIYYCQADAVQSNPVDSMNNSNVDYTYYRGSAANRMMTVFLKMIPGLRGFNEDEYWPLPGMIRMKLLFGLASTMRNGVLPPVDYYGVIYEYTKLSGFMDSLCSGSQKNDSITFKTDSSGINIVESSCSLLKSKPTQDRDSSKTSWRWKGNWTTWLDTSVVVSSTAETAFDFVYMVHMRDKAKEIKDSLPEWKFIGYFTEEMDRIVAAGNQLDKNFAMDTKKWTVILEKNPITGQELGWIEVHGSEEYCKDIHFCEKDISTTVRLDSNFARKLLQRKRRRNDIVFTESITLTYSKLRNGNWSVSRVCRFDGWKNIMDLDKEAIRCWNHMQNLAPMSLDLPVHLATDDLRTTGGDSEYIQDSHSLKTFTWIDDWQQLMLPRIKDDRFVDIVFERRKILCDIINKEVDSLNGNNEEFQRWSEFSSSVTDGIFHLNQQKGDRVKRIRKRRLIEPTEVSLSLQSTKRDSVIKLAPYPSFTVQRRVGKKSRLCCLFDSIEHIPTPITVTAVVNTQYISRWEMRCYFHEARDLAIAEDKNQLYLYAILSISGSSAATSIIKNDFHTQLWRWNETIIFRNLVFHEHEDQVFASPPMMVIEFFRKLPIHNDMFLGRCIIDSDNFVVQLENERHTEDQLPVLQWYKVHLRGIEDAGCVLAGFHFRCLNTLRPSNKIFENSILTPPEKNMEELFKQDRVVLDNRKRFEIPAEILPVLVPHVLKITSWGLRELRKYMLSRVSNPTIEFRVGHNVLQTETLKYDKSPTFVNRSHSMLIYLPLEVSYLPELFMVVRDSRAFGRAPLIGMTRIPLHKCRFKDSAHLDELEPDEINFFIDTMCGNIRSTSNTESTYDSLRMPIKVDFSREFFFLFEPPSQLAFRRNFRTDEYDPVLKKYEEKPTLFRQLKGALFNLFLSSGDQKVVEDSQSANIDYKMVIGDETLSKTKPDWWCKYYLSKTNSLAKAINYLEGDKLEFYYTKLENAVVEIGESSSYFYNQIRYMKVCQMLTSELTAEPLNEENCFLSRENQEESRSRLYQVQYNGFEDVFESINLMRCNQMTSDEENRVCGIFLGKVRLYYLGALVDPYQVEEAMEQLYRTKTQQNVLPYTQLHGTVPKEANRQDCLVRVYVVRALELQAGNMSSLPNSYIEVFMADNKKETQLSSSKANSIEMDSNPVYGRMFELYCIVPFQTRLRVRIMDKSTFLFDEEIGSTTIDLEKRMTTIYRSTCGLPQCYRQAGVNAWRDMDKPSEILSQVCRRFRLEEPHFYTENDIDEGSDNDQVMDETKLLHRYLVFPPGCPKEPYKNRGRYSRYSQLLDDIDGMTANVLPMPTGDSSDRDVPPNMPQPQDLVASSAFNEVLNRRKGNKNDNAVVEDSSIGNENNFEQAPLLERIKERVEHERNSMPKPAPSTFRLEDFDTINEIRGIHLGPSDLEPEICRERLALNILRRLPLVREHVETRPLYSPLQPDIEQGRLEMWVDIFSLSGLKNDEELSATDQDNKQLKAEEMISKLRELLPPPVDISPRDPQPYELRVVVWSVHDVISETDYGAACTGDLYVRAWMEGLGDTQETDVHYNSLDGEGEFNWRFVFQLDYLPHERTICGKQKVSLFNRILTKIPPMLHLQLWDNRRFRFDDFIGSVEVDLSKLAAPTRTKDSCFMRQRWGMDIGMMDQPMPAINKTDDTVNLFEVQRVYGYWPLCTSKSHELSDNKSGAWMVGKLLMELEMLSKEEATLKPAGLGRGEPNQNPHLPDPKRLSIGNSFLATSLAAFRKIFWPNYKWYCIGGVLMIIFVALLVVVIVTTPITTLTGSDAAKPIG
ncbi:hypothetical protein BOX15_Mlig021808g1 [Macrostomum lignano]|uniref:C2 domain-containing protein n=1 Tax=Macrostomum lignano TaxID=282301 RepID=A0A267G5B0_9PLAT|nr:hypothetical protein BOX15_Mlig021808g1 [Macrostomum lignano]